MRQAAATAVPHELDDDGGIVSARRQVKPGAHGMPGGPSVRHVEGLDRGQAGVDRLEIDVEVEGSCVMHRLRPELVEVGRLGDAAAIGFELFLRKIEEGHRSGSVDRRTGLGVEEVQPVHVDAEHDPLVLGYPRPRSEPRNASG